MIDNISKKGLVERVQNPEDRRSYVIRLTNKGTEHYQRHSDFHLELTRECTSEFSEGEVALFRKFLEMFIRHI